MASLKLKPGVITGNALKELFAYCKERRVRAAGRQRHRLATRRTPRWRRRKEAKAPVIVQLSHTGAQFYGGKTLDNSAQQASIAGAIAGALHVRTLAKVYGVPVVLHTDHCAKKLLPWVDGVHRRRRGVLRATRRAAVQLAHARPVGGAAGTRTSRSAASYLTRMAKMNMTLEIELGVTGGEEDGVDNSGVEHSKLYTQPEDVLQAYDALSPMGSFTVAASFGNTHGVYAPGNVKLKPDDPARLAGVHPGAAQDRARSR